MRKTAWGLAVVLAGIGALAAAEARKPATFNDTRYGFSLQAPEFPAVEGSTNVVPLMMFAPAEGGFSNNVNVMIQRIRTTRAEFRQLSVGQFKAMGIKVNADRDVTVSGKDAIRWDYEGSQGGKDLRWLAMAVIDTDRVFVVTCTATKESFDRYQPALTACLNSFTLGG